MLFFLLLDTDLATVGALSRHWLYRTAVRKKGTMPHECFELRLPNEPEVRSTARACSGYPVRGDW